MAFETYSNLAATTLTANYTAGSGAIQVASTAGNFPASPNFRVFIADATTGTVRVILKVTAVTDATHFAVTAEGSDANATSGDNVKLSLTAGGMDAIRGDLSQAGVDASVPSTTGQKAGNLYFSTDQAKTRRFDGASWVVLPGGLQSGAAFTPVNHLSGSNVGVQNFSFLYNISGPSLHQYPASWKVRMRFTAGSPVIGGMVILRTLAGSGTVIDSTTVKIGGVSNPTLTTPGLVDTDVISLALDNTHDYWFVIFFANTGANSTVGTAGGPTSVGVSLTGISEGFAANDQTGVSTIPSINASANPTLMVAGVMP